jgi:predicted NUDIX family phosphoesterase
MQGRVNGPRQVVAALGTTAFPARRSLRLLFRRVPFGRARDEPVSGDELVLGVPRDLVMPGGSWRGVMYGDVQPYLDLVAELGEFRARDQVERDWSFKQVIPYLVLRDRGQIFLMRRTSAGSDARLHERWSIGIGGHVNPEDAGVEGGLQREWSEEIVADFTPAFRVIGLLNDDTDPVGQVHLGIVCIADAQGREVAIRESHKLEGGFVAPPQVLRVYDRLETWSSLVYDFLTARAPGVPAAPLARRV